MPTFHVQSGKNYTGQTASVVSVTNMRYAVMMTTMIIMLNMTTVAKSIIKNTEDVAPTHHATCRDDECPVKNATLILNTDL